MNTSEVIRARRSIRKYKENFAIPQKDIETMLEAAMMRPAPATQDHGNLL